MKDVVIAYIHMSHDVDALERASVWDVVANEARVDVAHMARDLRARGWSWNDNVAAWESDVDKHHYTRVMHDIERSLLYGHPVREVVVLDHRADVVYSKVYEGDI